VARGLEQWHAEANLRAAEAPALATAMAALAGDEDGAGGRLLRGLFANSPFLSACALREPAFLIALFAEGPDAAWTSLRAETWQAAEAAAGSDGVMKALRIGKRRCALLAAVADLAGAWPLEAVTGCLSDYAELSLRLAVRHLLRNGANSGLIDLPDATDPETGCGYVILGMGKLGAGELNYSSDIDIIALFDPEVARYRGTRSAPEYFIRLTKDLVRLMEERTGDGYVFRTDLRLRPDPGSTAVCLSTDAAETYYESFGQNWERAAMIKVRAVAGDIARGAAFIGHLRPFVWRKSLDFYAIQDIHSIKRQINAVKGCGVVAVAGHNIKLGRGGIREIEFFAQTQQLIWGGREPGMRHRRTLDALNALVAHGHVAAEDAQALAEAYRYLRTLEHRLQMIDDAQTQTLPKDDDKLARLAAFCGHADTAAFSAEVRAVLCTVEARYAELFEEAPSLSEDMGNLVFTGGEDDPDTLQTLAEMGFANPQAVSATVRGWHHGRYKATRSTRAKEMLTELVPTLLRALGRTAQPDAAFLRFDEFLGRLPAGVQLFSMFQINPALLDLMAEIMGDAPRLAEMLSRRPNMLEAVLTPGFFDPPPGRAALAADLDALLAATTADYEDILDRLRLWANAQRFQVGVQTLRHLLDARQAGEALTAIADVVIDRLLGATVDEFARTYGHVPGGGMVVIAMGKMGGREMTATSDLDLITVYDAEGEASEGGRTELSRNDYFIRLTQRFIGGITALTREGRLYEVDMRLRPSGSKGPLAVSLEAFCKYNRDEAWTWENLALTRARVICGPPAIQDRARRIIGETLCRPRDADRLLVEVADMRALMARERKPATPFDVKLTRGGLIDVEFMVQTLILRHAADHPAVTCPNIAEAVAALRAAGLLEPEDANRLLVAQTLWLDIQGMLRHSISGPFIEAEAPRGLKEKLAKAAGEPDFETLKARMAETYDAIHALFRRLIEDPAEAARPRVMARPDDDKES
jgi:glutamate-ammonia-ligase adenylyltransferase